MSAHKEIFLKDYTVPNYWVHNIELEFDIFDDKTFVVSKIDFAKSSEAAKNTLELSGVDLKLLDISVDTRKLNQDEYQVTNETLSLKNLPQTFTLITKVEINPYQNFAGEGLYQSGDILCTQCEAEGFRRITYFLDRPDVMTTYQVKIMADKTQYPVLLSNGNKITTGNLPGERHFVTWEDPFKKPAYLFAIVAGDLALVADTYTTSSGREVALEIFVDPGNEDKCGHAMLSLKNSMAWDEEKFGLEYDLDIYMIVAVDSFNMGAMENKGLNIFNSSYVLAKQDTATDNDFQGIEGVIGHEYFHNWTGNRVTCRDWFQLTLKEGLTVFRDQEFSSDMLSRPVKRIADVKILRNHQFPEDAGPLSHPIKPKSFIEINNFYTATVYDKGAEIIRMIHTLLGADGFRKGMDLYFERHDGQAVTTEDFVSAMSDANKFSLEHFKVWYDQNHTPVVRCIADYSEDTKELCLTLTQDVKTNNNEYDHLYLPFHLSLYSQDGKKIEIENNGKFILNQKQQKMTFTNLDARPILSLNESFSAPVIVEFEYTQADLMVLMSSCEDTFNRYDSAQKLIEQEISSLINLLKSGEEAAVNEQFTNSYRALLLDTNLDHAFKAVALEIPSVRVINDKLEQFDFDYLPQAIEFLKQSLSQSLHEELNRIVVNLSKKKEFSVSPEAMGERALNNYALNLIFYSDSPSAIDLVYSHYQKANNMTDEFSALATMIRKNNPYREKATLQFYDKWKHETLVMQKWIAIQAMANDNGVEEIEKLEGTDIYNEKIPNFLRSLLRTFAYQNMVNFNDIEGKGYEFFTDRILKVDKFNPQISAGLAKILNYRRKLDKTRAQNLVRCLERIKNNPEISNDLLEVVTKNLS